MQNRLFEILYLLVSRGDLTAKELAAHFEVSTRTIYRDIDALCMAGVPLYTDRGRGGGIHLKKDYVLDRSLFTRQEQTDILAALQGLAAARYPLDGDALGKLTALFGQKSAPWIDVDFSDWSDIHKEFFLQLRAAITQRRVVTFSYFSSYGTTGVRAVEPLQLRFKSKSWYLWAYCRKSEDMRTFKLTRIRDLALTQETFERELPEEPPALDAIASLSPPEIVLKVDACMAYRVYDEFDPSEYVQGADGLFTVRTRFPIDEWLLGYVLSFGPYLTVLGPPGLREELRSRIQRMAERYSEKNSDLT